MTASPTGRRPSMISGGQPQAPARRRGSMIAAAEADDAPSSAPVAAPRPAAKPAPGTPSENFSVPRSRFALKSKPQTAPAAPPEPEMPFGRKTWPPPPGSSYGTFLEWASDGMIPNEDDVTLAIKLWAGWIPHPGPDPKKEQADEERAPSP